MTWIKLADEKPGEKIEALCWSLTCGYFVSFYIKQRNYKGEVHSEGFTLNDYLLITDVTHWMNTEDLPPVPKE